MSAELTGLIKESALNLGFDMVGISPAAQYPETDFYKLWIDLGYQGEMDYMKSSIEKRENIKNIYPEIKSVISCAVNYNTDYIYSNETVDDERGWISRYAWGTDYHQTLKEMLENLIGLLNEKIDQSFFARSYVDTGPVLEKVYAKHSGIGWIGKNTCLINQDIGSWLFIGEILTDLDLEYDTSPADRCGTCTKCIDSCPTGAITEPYVLDSRKCISYLTIELRDKIPHEFREDIENNIFGCDICQDVCPWNNKTKLTDKEKFLPRESLFNPKLTDLVDLDQDKFSALFSKSPVKRAKRKGLLRNVLVAMGNSKNKKFVNSIRKALHDDEPLVRGAAVWALGQLEEENCLDVIVELSEREDDAGVIEEIELILNDYAQ